MRNLRYILLSVILSGTITVQAQAYKSSYTTDTPVYLNDTVILEVPDFYGNLQWQKSRDLQNWFPVNGEQGRELFLKAETSDYYRAEILAGWCGPVYSDTLLVNVLSPEVKIFSNTENPVVFKLDSLDDSKITVKDTETVNSLSIGDIIVSMDGDGLMVRIEELSKQGDSLVLSVSPVALTDVVEIGEGGFYQDISMQNITIHEMAKGVKLNLKKKKNLEDGFSLQISQVFSDLDGDTATLDDQCSIEGRMDMGGSIGGELVISESLLQYFQSNFNLEEHVEITGNAKGINSGKWDHRLAVLEVDSVSFVIGGIPIMVRPLIEIWGGMEVEDSAGMHAKVTQDYQLESEIRYNYSSWEDSWTSVDGFTSGGCAVDSAGKAKFYLEPRIILQFFGNSSVSLQLKNFLDLEHLPVNGSGWEVTTGMNARGIANLEVLDGNPETYDNPSLYDIRLPLYNSGNTPNAFFRADPADGTTQTEFQLDASLSNDPSDPQDNLSYRWDFNGDQSWDTEYSSQATIQHRFTQAGIYKTILEVKNEAGKSDTISLQIQVQLHEKPVVETLIPNEITNNSAKLGGKVISDGGSDILERGVYWSTSPDPSNTGMRFQMGEGGGEFLAVLSALLPSTQYYLASYATNNQGTDYGNEIIFTTLATSYHALIKKTSTAPIIDGIIDAVWTTANICNIDQYFIGETPSLGDTGTTNWKALWSDDGIYILIQVNDDVFSPAYAGTNPATYWMYDMPEIYFDVNQDLYDGLGPQPEGNGNNNGHYQFDPGFIESDIRGGTSLTEGGNGSNFAFLVTEPTYVAEYFVPFTKLLNKDGIEINKAAPIGFDITIIDNDLPEPGRNRAVWSNAGAIDESWFNMDGCGTIILEDAPPCFLVTGITVSSPGNVNSIETVRGTLQMSATIFPADACNKSVKWTVINGTGIASISTSGLLTASENGTVTVRATANDKSAVFGEFAITISNQTVIDTDGNIYKTVTIGTQVWMAENLKTSKYWDGTPIPFATDAAAWSALSAAGYCWYNNDEESNKATYGALYNWYAVNTSKLCPTGWHVPSDTEWKTMEMYLGMTQEEADATGSRGPGVGTQLKNASGWNSGEEGTNTSGFSALPGGWCGQNGDFNYIGMASSWWSSTESTGYAWPRSINNSDYIGRWVAWMKAGFSVRCLKGEESPPHVLLPSINSIPISNISFTGATSGGIITYDGEGIVTARGVCWSSMHTPTTADSLTLDGSGIGTFTSLISDLHDNTTYLVRAYATNSAGTAYGNELSFTTNASPEIPMVSTTSVTSITSKSAIVGGNVTNNGGSLVTDRGVYWGTAENPEITGTLLQIGSGLGIFSQILSSLAPGTTYFVKTYATNSAGTGYGNEISFTTLSGYSIGINFNPNLTYGSLADIEGNVYKTIQIGTQIWMAENLKTSVYSNGDIIGTTTPANINISGETEPKYQWTYDGDEAYISKYGRVYTWYAVTGSRNVCPEGWHVPTDAEWAVLRDYLGGEAAAGSKLKEAGFAHWQDLNPRTNESGFTALPGGYRHNLGVFDHIGSYSTFWSCTESDIDRAWCRLMFDNNSGLYADCPNKRLGFSVRCLNDSIASIVFLLPTLTTQSVLDISVNNATCGGFIVSDGGDEITARGVCWSSIHTLPTISDSLTTDGSGIGTFTSSLTGLQPNLSYFIRAYATNSLGTGYGNEISFTTLSPGVIPPTLSTNAITSISSTSAICGGNITSDGGATVTARGVSWSRISNSGMDSATTFDGEGIGTFTSSIEGLIPGTTYFVKAYATNSAGKAYGEEVSFTTLGTGQVSDNDGNIYNTVTIGTQTWMTENLKTTKYNDNSGIPLKIDTSYTPGYCWYNNDETANKATYGALYNWYTVNTGKLCPTGWHVPTDAEWTLLADYLGGEDIAGGKLKEAGFDHWYDPNMGATNETGFTALPGGVQNNDGTFSGVGGDGSWWSSTEYSTIYAWTRQMDSNFGNVYRNRYYKNYGFSVRCLRD